MRDETANDNHQTAALRAFSSTRNLQFYRFQIVKFFFLDFGCGKIDMSGILRKSDVLSRRQDQSIRHSWTARLRARKNEPITSNVPLCLFHLQFKRSCYLAVIGGFRSVFFVAEKPLPTTRTCTVINFHNLHGQCFSLGFEQTASSD